MRACEAVLCDCSQSQGTVALGNPASRKLSERTTQFELPRQQAVEKSSAAHYLKIGMHTHLHTKN